MEGIVVGFRERSFEFIVAIGDELVRCKKGFKRRPTEEQWSSEAVQGLKIEALDYLTR